MPKSTYMDSGLNLEDLVCERFSGLMNEAEPEDRGRERRVLGHVCEPLPPEAVAILLHLGPHVGGKAPVLTQRRKHVRRCARAHIHAELRGV